MSAYDTARQLIRRRAVDDVGYTYHRLSVPVAHVVRDRAIWVWSSRPIAGVPGLPYGRVDTLEQADEAVRRYHGVEGIQVWEARTS